MNELSSIIAVLGFLAAMATSSGALAQQATVQIKNGPKYSGELLEYVPGDHITIGVAAGKVLRFASSDIASLDIGSRPAAGKPTSGPAPQASAQAQPGAAAPAATAPPRVPSTPPASPIAKPRPQPSRAAPSQAVDAQVDAHTEAPAPPPELVRAAAVHALLDERADWVARDTGLAAPILFTVVGVIAVGVGSGLQVAYEESEYDDSSNPSMPIYKKDGPLNAASLITLIGGGALLGSGFALWLLRTSEGRRDRELQRIDAQLRTLGVQTIMTPWISPTASGLSGGLSLRLAM